MVGWHHRLNGHEFGWTPGVGDGQVPGVHSNKYNSHLLRRGFRGGSGVKNLPAVQETLEMWV